MTPDIEDLFDREGKERMLARIGALAPDSEARWGRMSVGQMLAHCNVAYEIVHEPGRHQPPGFVGKLLARVFAKPVVIGARPYPRNSPTAPMFVVKDAKDFGAERARLVAYIEATFEQGAAHYEGRENLTFGRLTAGQWNTLFSKHLDHHLRQFGV